MNKEIAKKWIAALRSGKYKQTKGQLRSERNGFCCLGVLCNLHAEAHPEYAAQQTNSSQYGYGSSTPPVEVVRWAGLRSRNGNLWNGQSLAGLNDEGLRFSTIAKLIEQNVDTL